MKTTYVVRLLLLWPFGLGAQLVIDDDLDGASSRFPWQSIGGACLTAGNDTGSIPSCVSQGRMGGNGPDPVGQGALRLTDAARNRSAGVISQFAFPTNQGLQVTFSSVTYGGNQYGGTGADGISFFLIDADRVPEINSRTRLGAAGGSLGYSRASYARGARGIVGAYLGVGIDEYGNFSNPADTGTGGPGFRPNTIALRGSEQLRFPYTVGSRVQDPIASSNARRREDAEPITFSLSISPQGLLDLSYSRNGGVANTVLSQHPITRRNGPLPSRFYFGFAGGTGGGTNIHEITCFKAAGITTSGSSAGSNVLQAAKVQAGSQLYLAYYHTDNWWGQMTAQNILRDPQTNAVSVSPVANWDASCVLTGGECKSTGVDTRRQPPAQRTMLSHDGTQGIPLRWDHLPAEQQRALGGDAGALRLGYLRGARDAEVLHEGPYRNRSSVLGDIINSSPTWVGPPQQSYRGLWKDKLYSNQSAPEGRSYLDFAVAQARRTNVVYVGANDGMLHGFRAGGYDDQGRWDAAARNDGYEVLAYMPLASVNALHSDIAQLDYSSPQYAHNAFVDATPGVGDLYYQGGWHTWLVSGMGAGGNRGGVLGNNRQASGGSFFALDITDPDAFQEAHAERLVVGEWSSDTLVCAQDRGERNCRDHLGNTYGTPVIRRLHSGRWAVILGNGFNSRNGRAGVFIQEVDADGDIQTSFLDTGVGSQWQRNGIAHVTPVDLDGDDVVDFLYAGDLFGNVWRFDLSSARPRDWKVRAEPLFRTAAVPISTRLVVATVANGSGDPRLMVAFGSGQMQPQTISSAARPHRGTHYLHGVWDWDMEDWNRLGSTRMASLSASAREVPRGKTLSGALLQDQRISTNTGYSQGAIHGVRTITSHKVCWAASSSCPAPARNEAFGWWTRLPGAQEQVVYNPILQDGQLVVSTTIPSVPALLSCRAADPASGFTMALTMEQGAAPETPYFTPALSGASGLGSVVGLGLNAVGTPSFVMADGEKYMVTQSSDGTPTVTQVTSPPRNAALQRMNWSRLR